MKNDYIDMRDNGTRPEREPMTERRPKLISLRIVLTGAELIKIISVLCVSVFVILSVVLAFLSGNGFLVIAVFFFLIMGGLAYMGMKD